MIIFDATDTTENIPSFCTQGISYLQPNSAYNNASLENHTKVLLWHAFLQTSLLSNEEYTQ